MAILGCEFGIDLEFASLGNSKSGCIGWRYRGESFELTQPILV
jgi:hypothetical protein